jgi:hypothetical protein
MLAHEAAKLNRISEAESRIITKMATLLSRHILPLFIELPGGKPQLLGSGFLVSSGNDSYLISAAHVFDPLKNGQEPFYYIESKLKRKLSGNLRLSKIPQGQDRSSDRIDIGVLKLEGPRLPPYPDIEKYPLPAQALTPRALPREGKQYLLVGFPESQSRADPVGREVESKVYSFRNISYPTQKYGKLGVSPESHVVLSFDRKHAVGPDGAVRAFPNPVGMSGSPVFLLYDEDGPNDQTQTPVVGIAIEHRKAEHAIVATDIEFALRFINEAV